MEFTLEELNRIWQWYRGYHEAYTSMKREAARSDDTLAQKVGSMIEEMQRKEGSGMASLERLELECRIKEVVGRLHIHKRERIVRKFREGMLGESDRLERADELVEDVLSVELAALLVEKEDLDKKEEQDV